MGRGRDGDRKIGGHAPPLGNLGEVKTRFCPLPHALTVFTLDIIFKPLWSFVSIWWFSGVGWNYPPCVCDPTHFLGDLLSPRGVLWWWYGEGTKPSFKSENLSIPLASRKSLFFANGRRRGWGTSLFCSSRAGIRGGSICSPKSAPRGTHYRTS